MMVTKFKEQVTFKRHYEGPDCWSKWFNDVNKGSTQAKQVELFMHVPHTPKKLHAIKMMSCTPCDYPLCQNCSTQGSLPLSLDPTDFDVGQLPFQEENTDAKWLLTQTYKAKLRNLEMNQWLDENEREPSKLAAAMVLEVPAAVRVLPLVLLPVKVLLWHLPGLRLLFRRESLRHDPRQIHEPPK